MHVERSKDLNHSPRFGLLGICLNLGYLFFLYLWFWCRNLPTVRARYRFSHEWRYRIVDSFFLIYSTHTGRADQRVCANRCWLVRVVWNFYSSIIFAGPVINMCERDPVVIDVEQCPHKD